MNKKMLGIACVLTIALSSFALAGCAEQEQKSADFSGVQSVAELATLKCYYHNVAKTDSEGGWFDIGYKKVWTEYDGIVEVGVDVSQVTIGEPDENGKVQVHIPEAKILDVNVDKDSISDPLVDKGWFTDVATEEKTSAFAAAQNNMKEAAEQNTTILAQARERAKQLIEGYVKNVGTEMGKEYTVEWV